MLMIKYLNVIIINNDNDKSKRITGQSIKKNDSRQVDIVKKLHNDQ